MYFHLSNHISVAYLKEETIILDLKKDKYYIFDAQKTKLLVNTLSQQWDKKSESSYIPLQTEQTLDVRAAQLTEFISLLIKNKFIHKNLFSNPYPNINWKNNPVGTAEIDWRLSLEELKPKLSWPVLKALYSLTKVHLGLKFRGFYSLIQLIKKRENFRKPYIFPSDEELDFLVNILNQACLFYPIRTKCLEWAATFTLMGLKKGWRCTLNIGVQNYPFLSHAWTELEGKVIADSQSLPKNMAVILSVPLFNREIIR